MRAADVAFDALEDTSSWDRFVSSLPRVRVTTTTTNDAATQDESDADTTTTTTTTRSVEFGDDLDRRILATAVPSMVNLAVVPLVNAVDTFWVGRMGVALALAGQAAANQAFFTLYFLVAFLPTILAPLVAKAVSDGDDEAARDRVCEALFLSNVLGGLGTIVLVAFPAACLRMVLEDGAPALAHAAPYLRLRALSMVPALAAATGFSAYRGLLNTVTPLKVSLVTNAVNLVADPILVFLTPLGAAGAALATAASETLGGLVYLKLLLRRKLVTMRRLLVDPPSPQSLLPLLRSGAAMLLRQATLNVAFLAAARRAQSMDPSGVSAAAYGITMQVYSVGVVLQIAVQSTAAALVPSAQDDDEARRVADRCFAWGTTVGVLLCAAQYALLPRVVPSFSPLPEVREAVRAPAALSSLLHLVNGPVFAGEGCMLGLGAFKALATVTLLGVGVMVGCIQCTPLGRRLDGILWSLAAFSAFQAVGVVLYHLRIGPLARKRLSSPFRSSSSSLERPAAE